MGQIRNRRQKAGIFLTLGITFLSLLVLSLATLILRNAEDSDERLMELAGYDRVYNIDRAASDAFRVYDVDVMKTHLIANDTLIFLKKYTDRSVDQELIYTVFAKSFFSFYLTTLYNSTTVHTLPQLGDFGLTFERRKSNQNLYYRYMFIGNASQVDVAGGLVNGSWMHILSFNESFCRFGLPPPAPCDYGPVGSVEVIYQSNLSKFLNFTVERKANCDGACGTIKFRLKVINKTGTHLCVPPFPPDVPSSACNTWEDMVVSGDTNIDHFIKNLVYVESAAPNNIFRPVVLLGSIGGSYYYNPASTFLAVGIGNTTATVHIIVNVSGTERMRVFDVGETYINLDLGKTMRVTTWTSDKDPNVEAYRNTYHPGAKFPIRIL